MRSFIKEKSARVVSFFDAFRAFALRGNVVDMAVGIIIGASFNNVVSSLVKNIFMPGLGLLLAGINFSDYKFVLRGPEYDEAGKLIKEAVTLNLGAFMQEVIDFIIVAFALFLVIRGIYTLQRRFELEQEKKKEETERTLLREIRNILRDKKG